MYCLLKLPFDLNWNYRIKKYMSDTIFMTQLRQTAWESISSKWYGGVISMPRLEVTICCSSVIAEDAMDEFIVKSLHDIGIRNVSGVFRKMSEAC